MNKIEEIFDNKLGKGSKVYGELCLPRHYVVEKSAEITTDIAVKFTHFLYKYRIEFDGFSKQGDLYDITGKSEKQLFEEFINNHYGK
jgi:hypothetical protein